MTENVYVLTEWGRRTHLRNWAYPQLTYCGRVVMEVVDGPEFPRTLCDHCQRKAGGS